MENKQKQNKTQFSRTPFYKFGSQGKGDSQFCRPKGVCLDLDNPQLFWVCDEYNNRIQKFNLRKEGRSEAIYCLEKEGPKALQQPQHLSIQPFTNNVFVTDFKNNQVQVFSSRFSQNNNLNPHELRPRV